jgi:tetratricopeptide (TPR) repeat protein
LKLKNAKPTQPIIEAREPDFIQILSPENRLSTNRAKNLRGRLQPPITVSILLFVAVLVTFSGTLHNDFVGYDDPEYVTGNSHVRQGLQNALWAFQSIDAGNWHPLTWISHMLDCQIFGLKPSGHHFTSMLIHACTSVLLFIFLRRSTSAIWPSAAAAALFGLHPLRVESVAWVAERKDVLSAFFWMAALWTYSNYARADEHSASGGGQSRRKWYLATLVLFVMGIMSKPMVVTFPIVLLLLDYWPFQRLGSNAQPVNVRLNRRILLEKVPFVLLAVAAAITTFVVQSKAGAVVSDSSLTAQLGNVPVSYCRYLTKWFWPSNLAVFYPRESWTILTVTGAVLVLVAISTALWFQRNARPWLLVGWLWFLVVLGPVIGLVQAGEQAMADRYSYLPSIGIVFILAWGWKDLTRRWPVLRSLSAAIAMVAIVLCSMLTMRQIHFWKDTTSLFEHAIRVTENNYLAHNNLGVVMDHAGRLAEARVEFETAIKEKPNYAEGHNNLGLTLAKLGSEAEALQHYQQAIRLKPGYADPHNNLALLLEHRGDLAEAIEQYLTAIRLRPDYADVHYNLGIAFARARRFDEAIAQFGEVVKYRPDSADAHNNMGVALDQKGDIAAAVREYMAALSLNPKYTRAHFNLGVALARLGRLDDAIAEFEQAIRLEPNYVEARKNLDSLLKAKQQRAP